MRMWGFSVSVRGICVQGVLTFTALRSKSKCQRRTGIAAVANHIGLTLTTPPQFTAGGTQRASQVTLAGWHQDKEQGWAGHTFEGWQISFENMSLNPIPSTLHEDSANMCGRTQIRYSCGISVETMFLCFCYFQHLSIMWASKLWLIPKIKLYKRTVFCLYVTQHKPFRNARFSNVSVAGIGLEPHSTFELYCYGAKLITSGSVMDPCRQTFYQSLTDFRLWLLGIRTYVQTSAAKRLEAFLGAVLKRLGTGNKAHLTKRQQTQYCVLTIY